MFRISPAGLTNDRHSAKGLKTGFSRVLLVALSSMFIMTSASWALGLRALLNDMRIYIPSLLSPGFNPDAALESLSKLNNDSGIVLNALQDAVVSTVV